MHPSRYFRVAALPGRPLKIRLALGIFNSERMTVWGPIGPSPSRRGPAGLCALTAGIAPFKIYPVNGRKRKKADFGPKIIARRVRRGNAGRIAQTEV